MADVTKGADSRSDEDGEVKDHSAEKRHTEEASDGDDGVPTKKINMSLSSKPSPTVSQKISFNLGPLGQMKSAKASPTTGKTTVAPIKMSLNPVQKKSKEVVPVVQKSALAAKVFDESDESEDEEMPPAAKMRMKNIGRETPTASGPNSYGKGKQGFIDRHKIIEKQLKEDMEKVSGDSSKPTK